VALVASCRDKPGQAESTLVAGVQEDTTRVSSSEVNPGVTGG